MRIENIRPSTSFSDAEEVVSLAKGLPEDVALLLTLDVPLLPVLLDDRGLPFDLPNQFIASVALRPSTTGKTASTYAESLLSWLRYIKSKNIVLEDATEETLAAFRNSQISAQGPGGLRAYSSNTVNLRITVVAAFYAWMQKKKLISTPLGEFSYTKASLVRSYTRQGGAKCRASDSLLVPASEVFPRALGFEEIARLFAITPQPFKLMFRWGLVTGLRRFEVLNLRRSSLMTCEQIASSGIDPVPIDITRKGGKTATIYAPAALVEETHWYCLVDRPTPSADRFNDFVFLSNRCEPFTPGTLSRTFRKYANQIGIRATLHHLRHSFAIICLGYLEAQENRGGDINPIKVVQSLLGHSNITTTEHYLRTIQVSSDEVRTALSFLYGSTS